MFGNNVGYLAELNNRQTLSNFSYGTANTLNLSEDLVYDPNGNITNVNDLANGPRTKTFGYDALNRLTSAQASGLSVNESYTYDALNNLRSRVTGTQTLTYNYNPLNQLQSISSGTGTIDSFGYDNFGNQINKNGNSLIFDQKNQLIQIPNFDSYAYDASGRRVMKTPAPGGTPIYYFYTTEAGHLSYQLDTSSYIATNFIYLGNKLIARHAYPLAPTGTPVLTLPYTTLTGSYTVSWSTVSLATRYNVQEQVVALAQANGTMQTVNGPWTNVQNSSASSLTVSGQALGSYEYQVQACNPAGCGPWSIEAQVLVGAPATPTNAIIKMTGTQVASYSWNAMPEATSYALGNPSLPPPLYIGPATSYSPSSGSPQPPVGGPAPPVTPVNLSATAPQGIVVTACNYVGCSSPATFVVQGGL